MTYYYKYRNDLWKIIDVNEYDREIKTIHHPHTAKAEEKLARNIRRAVKTIEGYALCNPWEWFGTFTLSPQKWDRKDLDGFHKSIMQLLRDCRKIYDTDIQAVLVPELHKRLDGWHLHGLLNGLPIEALREFTLEEKLPVIIRGKLINGYKVYDWPRYRVRFGWVDIEPIRHHDAAARYLTKYLTKSEGDTAQHIEVGKHLYFVTRGLKKPELIGAFYDGEVPDDLPSGLVVDSSYSWDYGEAHWLKAIDNNAL